MESPSHVSFKQFHDLLTVAKVIFVFIFSLSELTFSDEICETSLSKLKVLHCLKKKTSNNNFAYYETKKLLKAIKYAKIYRIPRDAAKS